jgi:branched-chain amino acid transport system permease protein
MVNSSWGKVLVAIREDEDLAPHLGIDTTRYKRLTFAVASALTGLAGAVFISYQTYISSNYFTIASSFSILASTVIGGAGSLLGPVYGGLIVVGIPEIFRGMYQWRPSFVGVVLVAVVLMSPDGVNGLILKIRGILSRGVKK